MFGLSGAHRSGKSTICRDVQDRHGLHYHDASVTGLMKARGIDMVSAMTPVARLEVQEKLLDLYLEQLQSAPRPSITDRTPLDMAAYMLAEVTMHAEGGEFAKRVACYVSRCLAATRLHFDSIFLVHSLPYLTTDPDKPPASPAYQLHIAMLVRGLANQVRDEVGIYGLIDLDRQKRADAVKMVIDKRLALYQVARTETTVH